MTDSLTLERARRFVAHALARQRVSSDRVGLESEVFATGPGLVGSPRAPLTGPHGSVDLVDATGIGRRYQTNGNPAFDLGELGTVTFEPGAQIEHATNPRRDASAAIDDALTFRRLLTESAAAREMQIIAAGVDLRHVADDIPQYLPGPRYRAMADYFKTKGPVGSEMMRNSASIQINLDGGPYLHRRWRAANLISPLITATFSTSTTTDRASHRAHVWQELDPSRTGFPDLTAGSLQPVTEWILDAEVMFRWADADTTVPTPAGMTFRDWIQHRSMGIPGPTESDLRYHLTTVFPEVRVRHGVIELRAPDALDESHIAALVVLVTAAVYDRQAISEIEHLLMPTATSIDTRWRLAAHVGLGDDAIYRDCLDVWSIALGAARRNSARFERRHVEAADDFLHRFTGRRRVPGPRGDGVELPLPSTPTQAVPLPAPRPGTAGRSLRSTPECSDA